MLHTKFRNEDMKLEDGQRIAWAGDRQSVSKGQMGTKTTLSCSEIDPFLTRKRLKKVCQKEAVESPLDMETGLQDSRRPSRLMQ